MNATAAPQWDYTAQAQFYSLRPNYAPVAIDKLVEKALGTRHGGTEARRPDNNEAVYRSTAQARPEAERAGPSKGVSYGNSEHSEREGGGSKSGSAGLEGATLAPINGPERAAEVVADIGAGTGNLTVMLLERGVHCVAVEPNDAMRAIGIERTKGMPVEWRVGTGEETTLADKSVDLFAMGSSFNTTDREKTLKEAHRVLKDGGYFSCMWNHRDIENDPVQRRIEEIILEHVPAYTRGTRREDQTDVINNSGLFVNLEFSETPQSVEQTIDQYMDAWRSVKNSFWDLTTPEGQAVFANIESAIRKEFGAAGKFEMTYVTRMWTARKK